MSKKVIIVHKWGGTPKTDWYVWLKERLESENYQVRIPLMPNTTNPEIGPWVASLQNEVQQFKPNWLIGHSIGCQTILRWLEATKLPVFGVLFVAGWFTLNDLGDKESNNTAQSWTSMPINFQLAKAKIAKSVAVLSDDDPYVPLEENKNMFESKVDSEVVVVKRLGHIEQSESPVVLTAFNKLVGV